LGGETLDPVEDPVEPEPERGVPVALGSGEDASVERSAQCRIPLGGDQAWQEPPAGGVRVRKLRLEPRIRPLAGRRPGC